jgi:hypothetical protein
MEHGVYVQLSLVLPDVIEADVLGVPDQPGGLMIQGGVSLLESTHPKNDRHSPAL